MMARSRKKIILFEQKLSLSTNNKVLKQEISKSVNPISRKSHLKMRDECETVEWKGERHARIDPSLSAERDLKPSRDFNLSHHPRGKWPTFVNICL